MAARFKVNASGNKKAVQRDQVQMNRKFPCLIAYSVRNRWSVDCDQTEQSVAAMLKSK